MEDQVYPNLQEICRLCLKENSGTVCIFPKENLDKFASLSIPMRIMACAALEVQTTDGLPSKICSECRLQLEKSYYFRKQSQASDTKLRKHIRLVGMGKKSKVFIKKEDYDDDDDDDELEFKDTLEFIKEQEEKDKQLQQLQLEALKNEMKLQNEKELKQIKEAFQIKCKEELKPLVKEEVRNELREVIQKELEETMRKQIKDECLIEAKESLRDEVREECRQIEMKAILTDLQTYLERKKRTIATQDIKINKMTVAQNIKPLGTYNNNHPAKKTYFGSKLSTPKEVEQKNIVQNEDGIKNECVLPNNVAEEEDDINANEEENFSDGNFLIYDTEDGFELEKNPTNDNDKYSNNVIMHPEEDEYIDSNSMAYISGDEHMGTNEESEPTSTTSYHIEDSENGDIKFLKKSNDTIVRDDNIEQINDDNIMIINFPEAMEQDQIEMGEYADDCDEAGKSLRLKEETSIKTNKTSNKNIKSTISPTSSKFTTSSINSTTLESTFLTKTYTNPLQRVTDTPKIFKCEDCPMVFSTKPSLERHLRSHRKVEKTGVTYQCPLCQVVVSCGSVLRRHMFIHCDEKPFVCNECGKAFVQKEILKRHMQTHTGVKPHQCPHCDRAYAQRINLTQHIKCNHSEQPSKQQHSCHLCPKRFNHASGLSRHLASHNGVAFQCSECDRTFGDRSSIKRHIASIHGKGRVNTKAGSK